MNSKFELKVSLFSSIRKESCLKDLIGSQKSTDTVKLVLSLGDILLIERDSTRVDVLGDEILLFFFRLNRIIDYSYFQEECVIQFNLFLVRNLFISELL